MTSRGFVFFSSGVFLHIKFSSEGLWESCAIYIVKAATWLRAELSFTLIQHLTASELVLNNKAVTCVSFSELAL